MKILRFLCLGLIMLACAQSAAYAEGFALSEWSARGLGLAGGLVGRADDPSAIAFNAAGITQLEGTHLMVGGAFVAPFGAASMEMEGDAPSLGHSAGDVVYTQTKLKTWFNGHGYLTHQLNDNVWLGFGVFTRFGVGVNYGGDWVGRYNMYDVGLQTISAVPTIAYKVNDWLSLSLGVEFLYGHLYEGVKANEVQKYNADFDIDAQLEGQGIAGGVHLGALIKFNDQWQLGLAYKSQMTLNMAGDIVFGNTGNTINAAGYAASRAGGEPVAAMAVTSSKLRKSDLDGTVQLPDQLAIGLTYRPRDDLSFELGTVWTRWSTYNHLNIYVDKPYGEALKSEKNFRDGWNFNASVEWKALDWLTLRGGVYYETPVIDEEHADYMIPSYGRTGVNIGAGFHWNDFTLDMAYVHMFVNPLDYSSSKEHGVARGSTENCVTNIYSMSLTYKF